MTIVTAARAAVGTPFRAQGRALGEALDCVGLAAVALKASGFSGEVPQGYALRRGDAARVAAMMTAAGLERCAADTVGAVLLCASGPGQLHLAIATGAGVIHADAVLRRVVERPGAAPWPVIAAYRWGD